MDIKERLKKLIKPAFYKLLELSIRRASKEQKLPPSESSGRSHKPQEPFKIPPGTPGHRFYFKKCCNV